MRVTKGEGNFRLMGQERPLLEGLEQEWRNVGSHGKSILSKGPRKYSIAKAERLLVLDGQKGNNTARADRWKGDR